MTAIPAAATATAVAPTADRRATTRALLACGVLAGPVFVAATVAQELTRDGFDPRRHPLSMLSLGDLGWVQITNFVVCGLLALASAVGLRRALRPGRADRWGPILIGIYGASLIWGGVFVADPAFGFPPGTPDGSPAELSWHGILHGIAPALASVALVVACVVFARRFMADRRRAWARLSVAAAVVSLAVTGASFAVADYRLMLAGGAVIWLWAAAATWRVRRDLAG